MLFERDSLFLVLIVFCQDLLVYCDSLSRDLPRKIHLDIQASVILECVFGVFVFSKFYTGITLLHLLCLNGFLSVIVLTLSISIQIHRLSRGLLLLFLFLDRFINFCDVILDLYEDIPQRKRHTVCYVKIYKVSTSQADLEYGIFKSLTDISLEAPRFNDRLENLCYLVEVSGLDLHFTMDFKQWWLLVSELFRCRLLP